MEEKIDVSVILVNYNTKDLTIACIDSIFSKTSGVKCEVILVDNDSKDGSKEVFSNDERIIFVESNENLGFGKANNLGLTKAKGKYIFFLNTDTLLVNNAIKDFFVFSESHSRDKIGGIGCLLENANNERIHSYAKFLSLKLELFDITIAHLYRMLNVAYKRYDTTDDDETKDFFHVDYVTGADLFVSKDIIDRFGAFDPDFFMYCEETEMQYRWTKNGYLSYIIKTPRIIHLEGGSVNKSHEKFNIRKFIMGLESKKLYFKKTHGKIYNLLYRIISLHNIYVAWHHNFSKEQKKAVRQIVFSK